MLINLLTLMTGIVGLVTTAIAVVRNNVNPIINKYLIILFGVISVRFLLRGFSMYLNKIPVELFSFANTFVLILMAACSHLYFRDLVNKRKWRYKDTIHLFAPFLTVVLYVYNFEQQFEYSNTIRILCFVILIICILVYNYLSYQLLNNTIWSKTQVEPFRNKQTAIIKSWTLCLYVAIVFLGLMIILVFATNDFHYNSVGNRYQITIASLFWLGFFIKLLATPELLFGYDFMRIKIETDKKNEVGINSIWILNTKVEITNQKDLKISKLVISNLKNYIYLMDNLAFGTYNFRNPSLTLEDFAKELHIPIVHLLYVFKYHCSLTFVDYKKMIRIQDAVKLLESDFLKSNTMESLAKEVGFSSYKPFYVSFKSIMGVSPQEYFKNIK